MHELGQGCQTHFHWGHISLAVAFKGPNVGLLAASEGVVTFIQSFSFPANTSSFNA